LVQKTTGNIIVLPARERPAAQGRELVVEWFELHRADLLRYGRRILPFGESAEDLVQDIFLRVLRHKNLDTLINPRAFLMTVARNAAIDHLRRQKPLATLKQEEAPPPSSPLQETEMLYAIEKAIAELPTRCREVFVLRRFRGLDTAGTARELRISERMVQKHLKKAMAHFRERLELGEKD
jgi:RNA polymerase sigma-70 factor (ECF subfamily)